MYVKHVALLLDYVLHGGGLTDEPREPSLRWVLLERPQQYQFRATRIDIQPAK